jgi:hypothetical protein
LPKIIQEIIPTSVHPASIASDKIPRNYDNRKRRKTIPIKNPKNPVIRIKINLLIFFRLIFFKLIALRE